MSKVCRDCNFTLINQNEMSWNNYGSEWDIEHVIPINSFNLKDDEQLKKCFNWRNTRALNKTENMRKGDKIDDDYIKSHQQELLEFNKIINFKKI
jgi:hypothetical protein